MMCLSFQKRFFPLSVAEKYLWEAKKSIQEYQTRRDVRYLRRAIQYYEDAYRLSNQKHEYFTAILINYAATLNLLDQASSSSGSRSQIINLLEEARDVMEKQEQRPPLYSTLLTNLGQCFLDRYRETRTKKDYQATVDTFRLAQTYSGHCLPASIGLAAALWTGCEFRHSKDEISDLTEAIRYLLEALERSDQDSDTQAECFKNLGSAHNLLFQKTHNLDDLDKSVDYNEKAVNSVRTSNFPHDPNLAATTFNLSQGYFTRYTAMRKSADLSKADENNKEARRLVEQGLGKQELLGQIDQLAALISEHDRSSVNARVQQDHDEGRWVHTREAGPSQLHAVHKSRHQRSGNWASNVGEGDKDDPKQTRIGSQPPPQTIPQVHYRRSSRELS